MRIISLIISCGAGHSGEGLRIAKRALRTKRPLIVSPAYAKANGLMIPAIVIVITISAGMVITISVIGELATHSGRDLSRRIEHFH